MCRMGAAVYHCCLANSVRRLSLLVLAGLLTTACAPRDRLDSQLLDYQWRMGNVFELSDDELVQTPTGQLEPRFPRRRALTQEIPPLNINLLEFLRLSRCELQRLLGQRNSSLGMLMPSSQRFLYELSFLELAQACIVELQQLHRRERASGDDARLPMIRLLQSAVEHKQQWLAASYWNALWGSEEFQRLFSTATQLPRASGLQAQPVALEEALTALTAGQAFWRNQPGGERGQQLEQALAVVGSEKYLGQLRLAMATTTEVLRATTAAVNRAQQQRPICRQHRLSPRGTIMQRVFLRYYIGQVQPLISLVHQRVKELTPLLDTAVGREMPDGQVPATLDHYWTRVWADTPESERGQFSQAVADHTRMWQDLLQHCGLQPGSPGISGQSSREAGT